MRKIACCLLFLLVLLCGQDHPVSQANAILPVVAVAGISVGVLEALEVSAGVAAYFGVINVAQNRDFQKILGEAVDGIKNGVATAVDESLVAFRKVTDALSPTQSKSPSTDKSQPPGECHPDLRGNPRKCCSKFMDDFSGGNGYKNHESFLAQVSDKAWQVIDSSTGEVRCCLNWDWEHGRFEVYGIGGDGKYPAGESGHPYDHRGELTCDKIAHDPCAANLRGKADNSGKHAPREGCRFWHGEESSPSSGASSATVQ